MSFHLSVSVVSSCWNMNDNLCLFFFSFQEHHQSDVIVFSAPHVSRCVLSTCLITGNLSLDRLVEKGICEISALKGTIPPWWLVRVLWGHMLREVGGPSGALRLGDGHEGGGVHPSGRAFCAGGTAPWGGESWRSERSGLWNDQVRKQKLQVRKCGVSCWICSQAVVSVNTHSKSRVLSSSVHLFLQRPEGKELRIYFLDSKQIQNEGVAFFFLRSFFFSCGGRPKRFVSGLTLMSVATRHLDGRQNEVDFFLFLYKVCLLFSSSVCYNHSFDYLECRLAALITL